MNINWDVVWSTCRTMLVAGGPVGALLIALGFPPVQVGEWTGIGLATIGVAAIVVPGIVGALKQTDAGKLKAVATVPDVVNVIVKNTAVDGVAAIAADPTVPKVVAINDTKGT